MLKGVTVSELKDILAKVEPPKRLMDPITELPSEWDQAIIQKIKSAKSKEEILHLEEPVKATMPVDLNQVHPRIWIGNFKAAKVSLESYLKYSLISLIFSQLMF